MEINKELGETLEKSSQNLNNSVLTGGWEYSFGTGITRWTDEVYSIYGLSRDCIPNIESIIKSYKAESKVKFQKAINLAITKGTSWDLDLEYIPSTGKHIWVRETGQPIFDNGHISMLKGNVQCITEQKNNENSLYIISNLLNITDEAIFICETSGNIIYVNNRATEMYGLTRKELQNLKFQDIDDLLNDDERWEKFVSDVRYGNKIIREFEFCNVEGKKLPVNEKAQYIRMSGSNYVVIFLQDITEKKKEEQKFIRSIEEQQVLSDISYNLSSSDDFEFRILESLRIAGNYGKISRACIFEDLLSGRAVSNTFEWCNSGMEAQKTNLQAIPYSLFPSWKELILKNNIIEASELSQLPEDIISIFKYHEVSSMLAFPLIIDKKYSGFVSFIEALKSRKWDINEIDFYKSVSEIISRALEHKFILDSLRKSEMRFRELANLLPEIIFEMTINGKITFANKLACEKFKIDDESIKKGVVFYTLFVEEERIKVWEDFETIIKEKKSKKEQYKIQFADDIIKNVTVHSDLIMHNQIPAGLRAVIIDKTGEENKELAAAIKFPEEDPEPVLRAQLDGSITYCNTKGKVIKNFLNENFKNYFREIFSAIYNSGKIEEMEINIEGEYYYLYLKPVSNQNFIHIYAKNITRDKLEEEKRRITEQRLKNFSEIINEFIWESDINLTIKFISEKVKHVLGNDASVYLGKTLYSFFTKEEVKHVDTEIKEYIQKGFQVKTMTGKANKKDSIIWLQLTFTPIFDYNRKIIGIRGSGLEVASNKKEK